MGRGEGNGGREDKGERKIKRIKERGDGKGWGEGRGKGWDTRTPFTSPKPKQEGRKVLGAASVVKWKF